MPDEPEQPDRAWLVEPLGPNDVRVNVDVGDAIEVSEEARAALDTLVHELLASEVEGFAGTGLYCPSLDSCGAYSCILRKCQPLNGAPCVMQIKCNIQPLG